MTQSRTHKILQKSGHVRDHSHQSLPAYDEGTSTALWCRVRMVISAITATGCLIGGICILRSSNGIYFYRIPEPLAWGDEIEAFALAVNIVVALLTDSLGFIHATSLRWALYREDCLEFNTNIRLFRSSRETPPNRWPANVFWIICLILCYAATSQVFMRVLISEPDSYTWSLNGIALCALSTGLLGQVFLSSWCLLSTRDSVPTFGSNPLNNCLALLHRNLECKTGRCVSLVGQKYASTRISRPVSKQQSARRSNRAVFHVLCFVWLTAFLALGWAIALVIYLYHETPKSLDWTLFMSWSRNGSNSIVSDVDNGVHYPSWGGEIIIGLIYVFAIQGVQTVGLHCAELIVNLSRDESIWRRAYHEKGGVIDSRGAKLSTNALLSAISSWEYIALISFKASLHWAMGQSLSMTAMGWNDAAFFYFDMIFARIFVYAILTTTLAAFVTYLAYRQPNGCQPAVWGHFQTLANLIDDWQVNDQGCLFWGDKGQHNPCVLHLSTLGNLCDVCQVEMSHLRAKYHCVRHAGTSGNLNGVSRIRMDDFYAEYVGIELTTRTI